MEGDDLKRTIRMRGFVIPGSAFIYLLLAPGISDLISKSYIRNPSDFLLVNKIICVVGIFVGACTLISAVKLKKIDNANDAASSRPVVTQPIITRPIQHVPVPRRSFAEERYREQAARTSQLNKLKKELEELTSFTPVLPTEDVTPSDSAKSNPAPENKAASDLKDVVL